MWNRWNIAEHRAFLRGLGWNRVVEGSRKGAETRGTQNRSHGEEDELASVERGFPRVCDGLEFERVHSLCVLVIGAEEEWRTDRVRQCRMRGVRSRFIRRRTARSSLFFGRAESVEGG